MHLIDTNVISELRNLRTADPAVRSWAESVNDKSWFLSAVTMMELERGTLLASRRDEQKGATLHSWLHFSILPAFRSRILPVDTRVALRCAALHVPDPKPERDAMIAATALVHGLTIVTRNIRDFRDCGAPLINPWLYEPPAA